MGDEKGFENGADSCETFVHSNKEKIHVYDGSSLTFQSESVCSRTVILICISECHILITNKYIYAHEY